MKSSKNIFRKIFLALLITTSFNAIHAQEKDPAKLQSLINSKDFVFYVTSVSPLSGATRQLNADYEVTVSVDSLVSYLPYFGRAYSITPGEGGFDFTSTSFGYNVSAGRKGGWDIHISPKNKEVTDMRLSVSENDYAQMNVTSVNRQAISYSGYIAERK